MKKASLLVIISIIFSLQAISQNKIGFFMAVSDSSDSATINLTQDLYFQKLSLISNVSVTDFRDTKFDLSKLEEYAELDYAFYPEINMSSLGYINYDVEFEVGQIYDVCGLKSAKVINIMNNGDYNVVVNNYQFIMRNKSGEYIRDYLSTESALLRYIGEIEVISSGGYVHYRPHFELLVKDRSPKLKNILKECETW